MGCLCGKPDAADDQAPSPPSVPDFGLGATHEVLRLLGSGAEGQTWLVRERATGRERAAKLVRRPIPASAMALIQRGIRAQAHLGSGHPNLVTADDVIMTASHLAMLMDHVPGNSMVEYVSARREARQPGALCMDEAEARYFFVQVLAAVEHCHAHHVAHRDLKLDNALLDDRRCPPWLKLCDFGFAKHWEGAATATLRIGTPEYMGPELIVGGRPGGYDGAKVDVWAAGVLLHVMLFGAFPFQAPDDGERDTPGLYEIWLQQVKHSWREATVLHQHAHAHAQAVSAELADLLDRMLEVKPDLRIDVPGVRDHPWVRRPLPPFYQRALDEQRLWQPSVL